MLGSVLLGSAHAPNFSLSRMAQVESGSHSSGRYCGDFEYAIPGDYHHSPMFIPSRDKHIELFCSSKQALDYYLDVFNTIDSNYPGLSWQAKLEQIRYHEPHVLLLSTHGTHGTFSILTTDVPITFVGVYHPRLKSFHLVWSTTEDDLVSVLRQQYQLEYVFFRFPTVVNNSVFLPIQPLSAHWWRYNKNNDPLFAMNVMESKIFKSRE